jgi:hypothetical protein
VQGDRIPRSASRPAIFASTVVIRIVPERRAAEPAQRSSDFGRKLSTGAPADRSAHHAGIIYPTTVNGIPTLKRFIEAVPRWPGRILVAVGLAKLVLAGVFWLRTATWKPQTGVGALQELGFSQAKINAWLAAPRSWIGLSKIAVVLLRWPAFLLYLFAGFLLTVAAWPVVDALEGRRRRSEADSRFW